MNVVIVKKVMWQRQDNTPGFRFSNEFLCKFCLLDLKKGNIIYHEFGDDSLPKQFYDGVQ